jgi:uncharacterized membrane protein YfcA
MDSLLTIAVVFLGVFTQSLAGFGSALVAMALLPALIGVRTAAPLVAVLALTTELVLLLKYRSKLNVRAIGSLVAASIIGIPIGVWALRSIREEALLTGLGLVLVGYALYGFSNAKPPALRRPAWGYGFGFIAGLLGGAYNTSGPPVVIYASFQDWEPLEFKSNLQGFFIVNSILVVFGHLLARDLTPAVWQLYFWTLPALALGTLLGTRLDSRVNTAVFRKVVLGLLLIMGVRLIANGVA